MSDRIGLTDVDHFKPRQPAPQNCLQVIGLPRDCCKYKTKMATRNALNPIWEETFDLEISLPQLAFIRYDFLSYPPPPLFWRDSISRPIAPVS
jgi:hypothetical protein